MPVALTEEQVSGSLVETSELAALLANEATTAHSAYPDLIPPSAAANARLLAATAILNRKHCALRLLGDSQNLAGLAAWSRLDWDSEQFGFPAGRIDLLLAKGDYHTATRIKSQLLADALEECRDKGIRHITARADVNEFSGIHAFERTGFQTIDQILTFGLRLDDKSAAQHPGDGVELFQPEHLDDVLAIARTAYRFDRFHADPSLPHGVADRLHETWVRNSCLHGGADAVFVATLENRVAAFVTLTVDRSLPDVRFATIVLVASAEWARGKGMARKATYGAIDWCRANDIAVLHVGTQLRNIPASRLYESCGFRLVGGSLTLRKVFSGGQRL